MRVVQALYIQLSPLIDYMKRDMLHVSHTVRLGVC